MIEWLFEKLITQMSIAEPKWVVEPKKIPYAVYDSPDVVETANTIVKELGIKGEVERVVAYPSWYVCFAINLEFYGEDKGEEIAKMNIAIRDKNGSPIEKPDLAHKGTPTVWVYAISFIRSGKDPKFEDMRHKLDMSILQTYVTLYKKLVNEYSKFVDDPLCRFIK